MAAFNHLATNLVVRLSAPLYGDELRLTGASEFRPLEPELVPRARGADERMSA